MAKIGFNKNVLISVVCYLRVYLGLSQQKLAELTGLSANDICHIERGKGVQLRTVRTLAGFFHITIDTIINNSFGAIGSVLPSLPVINEETRARRLSTNARKDKTGLLGEEVAAQLEREKLVGTPYAALVNPNFAYVEGAGFDILSFTPEGKHLFIEVKASRSRKNDPFSISQNELDFMYFCLENDLNYVLYRIYALKSRDKYLVKIYTAQDLAHCRFTPASYKVVGLD